MESDPVIFGIEDEPDVISARKLDKRLAEAGSDVTALRDVLAWGRDLVSTNFYAGVSAHALVRANTRLIDQTLAHVWAQTLGDAAARLALVAVGGYGRAELLPHSDIDLLVLYPDEGLGSADQVLEQFLTMLWDLRLNVGHSVRSAKECREQAGADITIMTNLMEARLLAGDSTLHRAMQTQTGTDSIWPTDRFFAAKQAEQVARHAKYDDSGYKLEPNVKESPGGLRDIHTILWVAKRQFPGATLTDLKRHGLLTAQECAELVAGQDFLWRVRFALHLIADRHEDRLLFDYQVRIAELFGFVDQSHNRAVEQFMQLYYRQIKALSCLNDLMLQMLEESILHPDNDAEPTRINRRFQARHGYIEVVDPGVFRRNPQALLEIFLLLQKRTELRGIRAQTLRLIRRDRKLINDRVRGDIRAKSLFMEIIRQPGGLTRALRRMNRYGVLGRYIPAFGNSIGRMQYDLFHTLTVDEHTLFVVRNMRRLAMPQFRDEHPFFSEIMDRIPKPELLYLAGLFHDIAKGRGGDHSELGAEDAITFCLDHGLPQWDSELVAWLVRNHLVMSVTAQRKDITDPNVIQEFAEAVGDRTHLDYLFLMTACDIRATNPALWNSWRESLLKDLYLTTCRLLSRGLANPIDRDVLAQETQDAALQRIGRDADTDAVHQLWTRLGNDYFLRHSDEEIAHHTVAILNHRSTAPLVTLGETSTGGVTVFIYMEDQDHLFAVTTGVLAQLGLTVLDARLETTDDGYAFDSYAICEGDGSAISEGHRREEIVESLSTTLANPDISSVNVTRRTSRRLRHFRTPTQVYFSSDADRGRTIMELVTGDRPGLLSIVGRVFRKRGILLVAAKIGTIGERAEDVFFITDSQHRPINDPAVFNELRRVLTRVLQTEDSLSTDEAVAYIE